MNQSKKFTEFYDGLRGDTWKNIAVCLWKIACNKKMNEEEAMSYVLDGIIERTSKIILGREEKKGG